jgi:hypothetical protein
VEVVDLPTYDIIQTIHETTERTDGEPEVSFSAAWGPGQYARIFDRNWTMGDILKIESAKYYDVQKYISYQVSVAFRGKERTYRALALIHGNLEDYRLEFWDTIAGMGGMLTLVWEEQRIPYGFSPRAEHPGNQPQTRDQLRRKIQTYLSNSGGDRPPDNSFICKPGSKQCCIEQTLADFWEVMPCMGLQEELNKSSDVSNEDLLPEDIQFYDSGDEGHISGTGVHHGRARFRPTCTAISSTRQRCNVEIRDQGYGDTQENHSDIYHHVGTRAENSRGNDGPRGQAIECDAGVGFAFDYCVFSSCNVSMTLSMSGHGMGASATVTGGTLWRTARAQGNICNIPLSTTTAGGCNQSAQYGCALGYTNVGGICTRSSAFQNQCIQNGGDYDPDACACTGSCDPFCSPIVVDVLGDGFNLTNASTGVFFDIEGRGSSRRLSWTAEDSDDAWLALDRNNNGLIDSGKELFGNITAQDIHPEGVERNGFLALALYDSTTHGGNGDGFITDEDAIFDRLRLWQDENHNGVSESCELFTLPQLGLQKIDLDYRSSRRIDEHGNQFKYRSRVRDDRDAQLGRWAWDVFLVTQ